MAKKKTASVKEPKQEKKSNDMVDQFVGLVEHIISYFETLFIYARKLINQRIKHSVILIVVLFTTILFKMIGIGLLVTSVYLALLDVLHNNHILTSFILGALITTVTFGMTIYLIKRLEI